MICFFVLTFLADQKMMMYLAFWSFFFCFSRLKILNFCLPLISATYIRPIYLLMYLLRDMYKAAGCWTGWRTKVEIEFLLLQESQGFCGQTWYSPWFWSVDYLHYWWRALSIREAWPLSLKKPTGKTISTKIPSASIQRNK